MKETQVILNRLLDRFENSKHLSAPNTSARRVMLRIDKKELPEYNYESALPEMLITQQQENWNSRQSFGWNGPESKQFFPLLY